MNISNALPNTIKLPTPVQGSPKSPQPFDHDTDPQIAEKEAKSKAFYTKEVEPWKSGTIHYNEGNVTKTRPMTKDEYLDYTKSMSMIDIEVQQCQFARFRENLISIRPDLAGINISYTLDDEAHIKILDPDKVFSCEQLEWLSGAMNNLKDFKETVQSHAKKIMTLVDHDTETFGNRYTLNLMNFADTIDYGKIISVKDQHEINNAWVKQVYENGQHRGEPVVDIHA